MDKKGCDVLRDLDETRSRRVEESKEARMLTEIDTAFRQQRLKAWQPILTPKTVLPLFFAIGVIFAPIGGALLYASAQVRFTCPFVQSYSR